MLVLALTSHPQTLHREWQEAALRLQPEPPQGRDGLWQWLVAVVTHAPLTSCSPLLPSQPHLSLHWHLCCPMQGSQDLTVQCLGPGSCVLPLLPGLPNPISPKREGNPQLPGPRTGSCSDHPGALCLGFGWWLLRPQCHPCPTVPQPRGLLPRFFREADDGWAGFGRGCSGPGAGELLPAIPHGATGGRQ